MDIQELEETTFEEAPAPLNESDPAPSIDKDSEWLRIAKDAYQRSTTYFDANYRKNWEDSLNLFNSKHPQDSKYRSASYRFRSRLFRPKSRSAERKHEATAALALFSSPDVVSISPVNEDDAQQAAGSAVMKELLQYRLSKSIPWFLTSLGAFQDAMTVGVCASFQYWKYKTEKKVVMKTAMTPEGMPVMMEAEEDDVIEDKPCVELVPIENIRFDPAAKWNDVVGTTPYIILQFPMYIRDILEMMESPDYQGLTWKKYDKNTILAARVTEDNPLQNARDGNKQDPQKESSEFNEFDVAMVHLNLIKVGSQMFGYYTLKDSHILSEPKPIQEMFGMDEPPVVIGFCILETHKAVKSSMLELGAQLQSEANEIVNQRMDNVKYVLNKKTLIRRGANVDIEGWMRNVPAAAIMVNDVNNDVKPIDMQDVTGSSYQEQDRVNVDYDELLGNFAQSSVMTNRKLGETVGGMRMMAQGANVLAEYTIRMWVETWVEPVLRQLVKLEQLYETDEVILAIAGQKAQLMKRFGMDEVTDEMLQQELMTRVNVGMGATDPDTRFARFMQALGAYNQIAMQGTPELNLPEIRKELFGLAGFSDSLRFFTDVDPRLLQAQQMASQAKGEADQVINRAKDRINRRSQQLENRARDLDVRELAMRVDGELKDNVRQIEDSMDYGTDR